LSVIITILDIRTLIFHVFLPYAKLSRVRGRWAHLQRFGEKPPSLLTYRKRENCVAQIVSQECHYPNVPLYSN